MTAVALAADERLWAAFARYDAVWGAAGEELPAARLELCRALLACGEQLPALVLAQMEVDRALAEDRRVIGV